MVLRKKKYPTLHAFDRLTSATTVKQPGPCPSCLLPVPDLHGNRGHADLLADALFGNPVDRVSDHVPEPRLCINPALHDRSPSRISGHRPRNVTRRSDDPHPSLFCRAYRSFRPDCRELSHDPSGSPRSCTIRRPTSSLLCDRCGRGYPCFRSEDALPESVDASDD